MTTVEEIIDQIRAHFSPLDVVNISKSSPLQAKLRLLSYQINKDDKPDPKELAQEWYETERDKFDRRPATSTIQEADSIKHPLHEAWEKEQQRRQHQRDIKKRSRHNRAVYRAHLFFSSRVALNPVYSRDEWVDDNSKDSRMQQYMERISQHINEGTQWEGPQEIDPEAEFEQRLMERRERHYKLVKEESLVAQDKLKAKEDELNGHEERLQKRRDERRQQLERERLERERQLHEQEESRKKRREMMEKRQRKLEEEERELEEQERERQALWRKRQAEQLERREQEFARREQEWQKWEEDEAKRREEERQTLLRESEENAQRREAVLAADAEAERVRKVQEDAEIEEYVRKAHQAKEDMEKEANIGELVHRERRNTRDVSRDRTERTSDAAEPTPEPSAASSSAADEATSST